MKALVYTGVETLSFKDVAEPTCADGEVLVQVESVGICGSDMHAYLGHDERRPAPLVLGHEGAGMIQGGARHGERVTINPLVTCGTCSYCKAGRENLCVDRQIISMPPREGAFAQRIAIPERNLVSVPDGFSIEKAALAEPMAVSWHAVTLGLSQLQEGAGRDALVIGGGAIGLAAALALKAQNIVNVTLVERNALRRSYLSAHCDIDVVEQVEGQFALAVDAVGFAATRQAASAAARPGGVIVHIGLGEDTGGLDIRRLTLQEIKFVGTYTYTAQAFRDCAQAMFDGRLGALDWTETRPLSEGAAAFEDIRNGQAATPKILLEP